MKARSKEAIKEFLDFSGENKTPEDFRKVLKKVSMALLLEHNEEATIKLSYIKHKLEHGLSQAIEHAVVTVVNEDSEATLQDFWEKYLKEKGNNPDEVGRVKIYKPKQKNNLGKIVDVGETPYPDRSDQYWKERVRVEFNPSNKRLRTGPNMPAGYLYYDLIFLKEYYNLQSVAFGKWLTEADKWNYIAAMGIGLFDLYHLLGFRENQISLGGKLSVAFGARGRGAAAAHFEPKDFVINVTRYSRRDKKSAKQKGDKKFNYLTASQGMGAFAHEYGHALDCYAGTFLRPTKGSYLSGGRTRKVSPNKKLIKEDNVAGYMERLLKRIIWKNEKTHSIYYKRLLASVKHPYFFRRNEIFARAFESYIHLKLNKKKYHNIFLVQTKYSSDIYLTLSEVKALEKDFDQLVNAIKWKIKVK